LIAAGFLCEMPIRVLTSSARSIFEDLGSYSLALTDSFYAFLSNVGIAGFGVLC